MLADTFLISRVYTTVSTETASDDSTETTAANSTSTDQSSTNVVSTADSYSDDSVSITLQSYREDDTDIYVADILLKDPSALKTALAQNSYGKNVTEKTSDMAADNNAILAINGDYYGAQESGYVLRNGIQYRDTSAGREDLVIYADGTMDIINEDEVSAQSLLDAGAQQILSFGPALIKDGQIAVDENTEVGKAMASNPRTAIGWISDNHIVFVVSDGRTDESEGLSLYELAQFMQSLGCTMAYNLDGGGSSTMVFQGQVINNPTTNGTIKERKVSDIVYIG